MPMIGNLHISLCRRYAGLTKFTLHFPSYASLLRRKEGDGLRWQSGGVPQAEQSVSAKGHLADRIFVSICVSSLHR
jgi:hypothetical protein